MTTPKPRQCNNCVHAFLQDTGYSNWTVEGTNLSCSKNELPWGEIEDIFYGKEEKLRFAEQCDKYEPGEPEHHLVDCPYECEDDCQEMKRRHERGEE